MDIYPDAKVVLTTRDPDRWLASIRPVAANSAMWWVPYLVWPVPGWRWFPSLLAEFGRSTREILADGSTEANPKPSTSESACVRVALSPLLIAGAGLLLNWNAKVKAMVPEDRLLVVDLREGWEPLCKFLDVPVPGEPLPRANDATRAGEVAQEIFGKLVGIWVGVFSVSGLLAVGAWRLRRSW